MTHHFLLQRLYPSCHRVCDGEAGFFAPGLAPVGLPGASSMGSGGENYFEMLRCCKESRAEAAMTRQGMHEKLHASSLEGDVEVQGRPAPAL